MDNRRKHARFSVAIAAEVDAAGEILEAETRDLSEGGVSVLIPEGAGGDAVAEGRSIGLTLILTQDGIEDPDEPAFVGKATIIWSAPTDSGHVLLGLRIAALPGDARTRLQRFLAKLA